MGLGDIIVAKTMYEKGDFSMPALIVSEDGNVLTVNYVSARKAIASGVINKSRSVVIEENPNGAG